MKIFNSSQIHNLLTETIKDAEIAFTRGNYPVGALIVNSKGHIVVRCQNESYSSNDITAHAEIQCLRKSGIDKLIYDTDNEYYLFTSLEPCCGCGFFIARTNIKTIYMATIDTYRSGTSVIMKSKRYVDIFKHLKLINCAYPHLTTRSRQLMRDYYIKKGKPETAKKYQL